MSPNRHSIEAVSTAKKFKTPLKASVVLLTSMILAACNTTDDPSYNMDDIFSPLPGATDKEVEKAKEEAEKAKAEAEKAKAEAEAAKKEAAKQIAAAEKAAAEKTAAAIKAKEEAQAATAAAEKAKADAIKAKEEAEKALEEALANGGGSEALQKEAERKAKLAEKAQADAVAAQTAAQAAQQAAEAQASAAAAAQKVAEDATTAAAIKNTPETKRSGVQSLSIDAKPLKQVFATTTRDFESTDNSIAARADTASGGLLPIVNVTTSGTNDTDLQGGFKSHKDNTDITTSLGVLPLTYTSTYKDFGDDMRIGHIDGAAALGEEQLPVNGVAVVGKATQAANMPTEGKVGYTGDATYRKLGIGNAIEFGKSVFTADFVAKNVKGDLTFANAGKIGLTAGITGNQFSGSAANNAGYATEGGFFGGDAQYLGGVYEGNGAQGTYGAKSDKQTAAEKAAKDAQTKAAATEKALATAQAQATQAQAAATKAQADAVKAKEEARKAQEAADNAGTGGDDKALQEALDRAEAAEEAVKKAKEDADAAIQAAADKAQEAVKAAQDKVKAAQSEATAAKASAAVALAAADAAEKDAAAKIAAAKSAAAEDVTTAKAAADKAIADAKKAKEELKQAQEDTQAAEDRATAAAEAQAAAEQKAQDLKAQLDSMPKFSYAETKKSGIQHLSVDATALGAGVNTTTTRNFVIRSTSDIDARADLALEGVLEVPKVAIQVSGDNDADTESGFKSYEGTANVLGEGDLAYTSIYKDFGDNGEMRIAHIDGVVSAGGGTITAPVDGVAVVGNKTATLPTEGTFEYAGDATNRKVGLDNTIEYGSSEFTADFVANKVDGTLKFVQAGQIDLSATIAGNEFSGTADTTGYNTEGAFYGKDANFIGGIYEGSGSQGTFGAEKDGTAAVPVEPTEPLPEPPVNETYAPDENVTGFQSFTLSNADAIGFRAFWDDNDNKAPDDGTEPDGDGSFTNTSDGNNFANDYQNIVARADLTKANTVLEPVTATIASATDDDFAGGNGFKNYKGTASVQTNVVSQPLDLKYDSVYKNFNNQMQIGHIYGEALAFGVLRSARVSSTYVQGNLTAAEDMTYMKDLAEYNIANGGDGKVAYEGVATYMENLHFNDMTGRNGPTVDGSSKFDVDFVNSKLEGTLSFDAGDYTYMPEGNKIGISADINGSNFAGTAGNVQTAGGFYGEDANYLGGIYQNALQPGGSGGDKATGTTFQGTFGAEKQ